MWVLHAYLDRTECLGSRVGVVRGFAEEFQDHHSHPSTLLAENHVGTTDNLVTVTGCVALCLAGVGQSPLSLLIVSFVAVFGSIAAANHYFNHASFRHPIPWPYRACHRVGLLPSPMHHRKHHTSPFDVNWEFLVGLGPVYQAIHEKTGSTFALLHTAFWLVNPVSVQILVYLSGRILVYLSGLHLAV